MKRFKGYILLIRAWIHIIRLKIEILAHKAMPMNSGQMIALMWLILSLIVFLTFSLSDPHK